jgi:hypothetical protein
LSKSDNEVKVRFLSSPITVMFPWYGLPKRQFPPESGNQLVNDQVQVSIPSMKGLESTARSEGTKRLSKM